MEQQITMFVSEKANVTIEDARMAVLRFRVMEMNGERHVLIDGNWSDVVEAFMHSDIIVVEFNPVDSLPN